MNFCANEFLKQIINSKEPIRFFNTNKHIFQDYNSKKHLLYLLESKSMSKSQTISASGINVTYAYHIFSGDKKPSRDKVLSLAFAFQLNLNETQHLLRQSESMELYLFNFRDAIIIHAISNGYSLMQTNNLLHELAENIIE